VGEMAGIENAGRENEPGPCSDLARFLIWS
jgi:hypothetical protein